MSAGPDSATGRLLDASVNRCREAIRTVEDVVRFALDDAELCARFKNLRHELQRVVREALESAGDGGALLASRDTAGDVGTGLSNESERSRRDLIDVARAACARMTESLRSVEEALKTFDSPAAARIEALRYEAYELERAALLALGPDRAGTGWRLCALITESLCAHHSWEEVTRLSVEAGVDCLQLREKHLEGAELLRRSRRLIEIARPRGAAVVVNDRVDVALAAGADGVHLGPTDLPIDEARRLCGFRLRIGASTSTLDAAREARRQGADVCGVGAMFATTSKENPNVRGPEALREYLEADPPLPPALAIGGITPENVIALVEAAAGRAFGVAVSACVCGSRDPGAVCAALLERLGGRAGSGPAG